MKEEITISLDTFKQMNETINNLSKVKQLEREDIVEIVNTSYLIKKFMTDRYPVIKAGENYTDLLSNFIDDIRDQGYLICAHKIGSNL